MALHRGGRLRHAEVFLRQGLLDRAIEEHVRVTTERPDDWPALVALGNLYLRARSVERAAAVFERVAGRAAAVAPPAKALSLHEAILKFAPRSEPVRLHAAHALKTLAVESAAAGRLSESLALCERGSVTRAILSAI
jgi:tetratricopeptide (TPR) repeat protein